MTYDTRDTEKQAPRSSKGSPPTSLGARHPIGGGRFKRASDGRGSAHPVLSRIERTAPPGDGASALAARAQAGDDLAFAELYVMFFDRVRRYLVIALKNPDDAQEAAQDVFARALRTLERFDPNRGEFRDWLFSMVRSIAMDHLRTGSRAEEVELQGSRAQTLPMAERAATLLDDLDPNSGARALIEGLPELQQRVLALRFVFGFTTNEICDITGSTPDAIRHVQHRALKTLSAAIAPRERVA